MAKIEIQQQPPKSTTLGELNPGDIVMGRRTGLLYLCVIEYGTNRTGLANLSTGLIARPDENYCLFQDTALISNKFR